MNLEIIKSPQDAHTNILFGFIKKSLIDYPIFDNSGEAFPYSSIRNAYKIRLSDCFQEIKIKFNGSDWLYFNGTLSSDGIYEFYLPVKKNRNELKVVSVDDTILYKELVFRCYNIQIYLSIIAKTFKGIWNNLYQGWANTYYKDNVIQDLDGNYLVPKYSYTREVATLLGTKRYSKLSNSQYYTFLHNIYDMNVNAGTYEGFYKIQKALPDYIDRIDIIPLEKYLIENFKNYEQVYRDTTSFNKIKVFPTYTYFKNQEWGLIGNQSLEPDYYSYGFSSYAYVDGDIFSDTTNVGSLKIKFSNDPNFYKKEYSYTDIFASTDILNDSSGVWTGFDDGKYVILRKPLLDATISVDTTGSINVNNSAYLTDFDYNLVSLGSLYSNQINYVSVTYKTYDIYKKLARIERDNTTGDINKIFESGHIDLDAKYLSYLEENYGSVVIVIRAIKKIDNELKDILNNLIRNVLPIHIKYYFVIQTSVSGIMGWYWWGQEDITFEIFDTTGALPDIQFADLE